MNKPSDNIEKRMQFQLSLLRLVCHETAIAPVPAPASATEKIEALVRRLPPPPAR